MSNSIACVGGLVWDETIRPIEKMIQGTSNPVTSSNSLGGVAQNVAAGLAGLGVGVSLFSIIGRDPSGDELLNRLAATPIDTSGVTRSDGHSTARYSAIIDTQGELIYGLADMEIFSALSEDWFKFHESFLASHPIWVVDCNLPAESLRQIVENKAGTPTILVDPVSVAKSARLRGLLSGIDVLFPDRQEAAALAGMPTDSDGEVEIAVARLLELGTKRVVVSLGADGVYVADLHKAEHRPAIAVDTMGDVTGAGDALLAGYAYGLLNQSRTNSVGPIDLIDLIDPIDYGLAAASLIVESVGASDARLTPGALANRVASR